MFTKTTIALSTALVLATALGSAAGEARSYGECQSLAAQRGWVVRDLDSNSGEMRFIDACMAGRQR
jgi:hypothetical protein